MELCEKKQKRCSEDEEAAGDMWDHTAVAADSKLVVSLVVGKRTQEQTTALVQDAKSRLRPRHLPAIFTDAYALQLSKGPSRDPQPRETSETQPYLILSRLSRPRIAARCLAARRYGRPLLHAGGAAMAARKGRPPAGNAGMLQGRFRGLRHRGDGAKMAFVLPIRQHGP